MRPLLATMKLEVHEEPSRENLSEPAGGSSNAVSLLTKSEDPGSLNPIDPPVIKRDIGGTQAERICSGACAQAPSVSTNNPADPAPDSGRGIGVAPKNSPLAAQTFKKEAINLEVLETLKQLVADNPHIRAPKLRMSIPSLQVLEHRQFLAQLESDARTGAFKSIFEILLQRPHSHQFMTAQLPVLLHACDNAEVAKLLGSLLSSPDPGSKQIGLVRALLTSRQSLKALSETVSEIGHRPLLEISNSSVRNLVAWGMIGPKMRRMRVPKTPSSRIGKEQVVKRIESIQRLLNKINEITRELKELEQTEVARRYRQIANDAASQTRRRLKAFEKVERMTRGSSRREELFIKRRSELAAVVLDSLKCEMPYGINLTIERNKAGGNLRVWKCEDLKRISSALKKLPDWLILYTPFLKEIKRVAGKSKDYNGMRDRDGIIHVPDLGISDKEFAKQFDTKFPTAPMIFHEIGHSYNIACDRKVEYPIDPSDDRISCTGEYLVDFQAFLELSDWRAFEPSRFKIEHHGQAVRLDHILYPLERPCRYKGELVIFRHCKDQSRLYCHRADATFNLRDYATSDPFEDFADAFAEYFELPERLAYFSPEKFLFFELHFHVHERKKYLFELVDQRLGERKRYAALEFREN